MERMRRQYSNVQKQTVLRMKHHDQLSTQINTMRKIHVIKMTHEKRIYINVRLTEATDGLVEVLPLLASVDVEYDEGRADDPAKAEVQACFYFK